MMMESARARIELPTATLWIDERGFLYCRLHNNDFDNKLGIAEAKEHIKAICELCAGTPMPFLIDARDVVNVMTSDARKLMANSPELRVVRLMEAFVVNSLTTRLSVNFFTRIHETGCPSRIFEEIDEAIGYCINAKKKYKSTDDIKKSNGENE